MSEFIQKFGVPCEAMQTLPSTTVSVLKNLGCYASEAHTVLCMPYEKEKDGTIRDLAFPANDSTLQMIQKTVIAEYEKVTGPRTRSKRRVWLPT